MTLNTDKQLASNVIDAIHRYIGPGFMTKDNTGKTVYQVIKEWESSLRYDAQSTCECISIMVLGGNLTSQVEKIKNLIFIDR